MKSPQTDIVRAMLDRLHAAFSTGTPIADDSFWSAFEADIRAEYGGDRHYIHATSTLTVKTLEERNRRICTDYYVKRISASALQEKYGLSRQMIYNIANKTLL